MVKIFILIALLPHLFCTMVHNTIPCSKYFTYMIDPETRHILGQIKVPTLPEYDEFYLKVALNTASHVPRELANSIQLQLAQSIKESIQAVQQGRSLLYHIYFPWIENKSMLVISHYQISISAIWFNDQLYCLGPEASSENIKATIELGHIVYPPNKESFSQNFQPWHRNSSSYHINHPTYNRLIIQNHSKPIIASPFYENVKHTLLNPINNNNDECGITSYYTDSTNSLIPNGEDALPAQWPWMAILFANRRLSPSLFKSRFRCSGYILTNRHILTAANCLRLISTNNDTMHSNELEVAMGLFNWHQEWLQWLERGTLRKVASYEVHSESEYATNDSIFALAILTLKSPVEFSPFIKPICLWSGSTDFENVAGRTGYVMGYGIDKLTRRRYKELRMNRMLLASEESQNCHRNVYRHPHFPRNLALCANLQYRRDHCISDSGSGLVLYNTTTGRYQLRGVVAQLTYNSYEWCKISGHVVFVDVAKYIPWIQQQISTT